MVPSAYSLSFLLLWVFTVTAVIFFYHSIVFFCLVFYMCFYIYFILLLKSSYLSDYPKGPLSTLFSDVSFRLTGRLILFRFYIVVVFISGVWIDVVVLKDNKHSVLSAVHVEASCLLIQRKCWNDSNSIQFVDGEDKTCMQRKWKLEFK